ncbi:MAG: hypothetical protein KDK70_04840, partial [Myxococcales bacterium]|nr:hypothetical protein [Myxococcales bacterium]
FIDLAMGVLLAFSDEDGAVEAFHRYWPVAQLLWHHSNRLWTNQRGLSMHAHRRAPAAPTAREEAFGALWDRHPDALVALLAHSRCAPVHQFAATALRANPSAWDRVDGEALVSMLAVPYEPTLALAVDIVQPRLRAGSPDRDLLLALGTLAGSMLQRVGRG